MRRSLLVSLALVSVLTLGITASSHASTARPGLPRQALGARAAAAARAGLERVLSAETGPVGRQSSSVHRVGPYVAANNSTWSGYVADNTRGDTYTQVTGTWDQPAIKCAGKETQIALFFVGLDGWVAPANTVEQTGTMAECFNNNMFYYTWWQTYPGALTIVGRTVRPLDTIVATVSFNAGNFTMTVNDATTAGNNINTVQPCPVMGACARQSAEWIAEAPSGGRGFYPLVNFVAWNLTAGTATSNLRANQPISMFPTNQLTLIAANPWGQAAGNYPLATPGALNPAGDSFTGTWNNSY